MSVSDSLPAGARLWGQSRSSICVTASRRLTVYPSDVAVRALTRASGQSTLAGKLVFVLENVRAEREGITLELYLLDGHEPRLVAREGLYGVKNASHGREAPGLTLSMPLDTCACALVLRQTRDTGEVDIELRALSSVESEVAVKRVDLWFEPAGPLNEGDEKD